MRITDLQGDDLVKEVTAIYSDLKTRYSSRNKAIQEAEDLYFLKHWPNAEKEGEERVTLPTHMNAIDLAQGILAAQDMKITALSKADNSAGEATANDVERFCNGVIYVNNERREENIRSQVTFNQLLYAWGVVRTYWDVDLAGGNQGGELLAEELMGDDLQAEPIQQEGWEDLPIVLESIHPSTIFPMPGGKRGPYKYIIYGVKRSVADVEEEWGVVLDKYKRNKQRSKEKTEIDYIDYWGWEGKDIVNCVIAGREIIKPASVEEGYRELPYTLIPCKKTASLDSARASLGMLEPIKEIVHHLETTLTKQNRAIKMWAWAPPVYKGPPSMVPNIDSSLGNIIPIPPEADLGFMGWVQGSPDVGMQINIFKQEIQEGSFPSVTFGQGPGAMSGFALSTLSEGGRIRLQMPRTAQEIGWQVVFRKVLSMARQFSPNTPLQVWGDFKGQPFSTGVTGMEMADMQIRVQIGSKMPQDKSRDEAMGSQLQAQGIFSERTLLGRYFNVDDPDKEIERKMVEKVEQHPAFMILRMAQAAMRWGIPEEMISQTLGPVLAQTMMQATNPMGPGPLSPQGQVMQPPTGGNGQPGNGQPQGGAPPARPRVAPSTMPQPQQGQMTSQQTGMAPNVKNVVSEMLGGGQ